VSEGTGGGLDAVHHLGLELRFEPRLVMVRGAHAERGLTSGGAVRLGAANVQWIADQIAAADFEGPLRQFFGIAGQQGSEGRVGSMPASRSARITSRRSAIGAQSGS